MQKLVSIQPRTSLVNFARSPRTDPPGVDLDALCNAPILSNCDARMQWIFSRMAETLAGEPELAGGFEAARPHDFLYCIYWESGVKPPKTSHQRPKSLDHLLEFAGYDQWSADGCDFLPSYRMSGQPDILENLHRWMEKQQNGVSAWGKHSESYGADRNALLLNRVVVPSAEQCARVPTTRWSLEPERVEGRDLEAGNCCAWIVFDPNCDRCPYGDKYEFTCLGTRKCCEEGEKCSQHGE